MVVVMILIREYWHVELGHMPTHPGLGASSFDYNAAQQAEGQDKLPVALKSHTAAQNYALPEIFICTKPL